MSTGASFKSSIFKVEKDYLQLLDDPVSHLLPDGKRIPDYVLGSDIRSLAKGYWFPTRRLDEIRISGIALCEKDATGSYESHVIGVRFVLASWFAGRDKAITKTTSVDKNRRLSIPRMKERLEELIVTVEEKKKKDRERELRGTRIDTIIETYGLKQPLLEQVLAGYRLDLDHRYLDGVALRLKLPLDCADEVVSWLARYVDINHKKFEMFKKEDE